MPPLNWSYGGFLFDKLSPCWVWEYGEWRESRVLCVCMCVCEKNSLEKHFMNWGDYQFLYPWQQNTALLISTSLLLITLRATNYILALFISQRSYSFSFCGLPTASQSSLILYFWPIPSRLAENNWMLYSEVYGRLSKLFLKCHASSTKLCSHSKCHLRR